VFVAGATRVDLSLAQVQRLDRIHPEVGPVIGGHPVAKVRRP
jgi:hypothetical protein